MSAKIYYQKRASLFQSKVAEFKRKSTQFALFRLCSFLAVGLSIYFLYNYPLWVVISGLTSFSTFLFFVRKSVDIKHKLAYYQALLAINENELKVLNSDFSNFENGKRFINPQHPFTYDLDVFGEKSIYQFLNRTVSKKGEALLASYLEIGVENPNDYQESTKALLDSIDWSQEYRAVGQLNQENEKENALALWLRSKIDFSKTVNILRFVLPVIAILSTAAYSIGLIQETYYIICLAICFAPISVHLKKTNSVAANVGSLKDKLRALNSQINLIKELKASSKQIEQIKAKLFKDSQNADKAFKQLIKQIERFDMRNNIIVSVLFNLFLAYDFQLLSGLSKWKEKYGDVLLNFESLLVEIEVIISMTNLKFNAPSNTFPKLSNDNNSIEIIELGHPLLLFKQMVKNDYKLKENEAFSIITGPNMAGKSTFLRSVGVNLMLAKAGFSVVAKSFSFPNLKLYSSMRTADNLTEESSYFHAELVRLRFIADAIDRGEEVFIILDEILKGTNSKDKEEGSAKFLTKLVSQGAKGIIATHDLSLTKLANKNTKLVNQYFDSTITGDSISFSYTINYGVVKNMNASFLLKQMNLVD